MPSALCYIICARRFSLHLVVRAISSILKLLEFLRCDAPVCPTLALCYIICARRFSLHLVVRAISSILKLLEFLRCDAPVCPTLAWWQRLLTHVSESLRSVSLIRATTSLPILWSIEGTLTSHFHLKESITSPFLIVTSSILIELQSSGPSQTTKPLLHSKLGDIICNIPFLLMLILPRF